MRFLLTIAASLLMSGLVMDQVFANPSCEISLLLPSVSTTNQASAQPVQCDVWGKYVGVDQDTRVGTVYEAGHWCSLSANESCEIQVNGMGTSLRFTTNKQGSIELKILSDRRQVISKQALPLNGKSLQLTGVDFNLRGPSNVDIRIRCHHGNYFGQ